MNKLAVLIGILLLGRALCGRDAPQHTARLATWNIENYPRSQHQETAAFTLIDKLGVTAVGVQEITDPRALRRAAQRLLGASWRFVHCRDCPRQRVGVLYDADAYRLLSTRSYRETVVYPGAKPAFEARLQPRRGTGALRVIVVHLKAGGNGVDLRRRQFMGLHAIVRDALDSGDALILLGDFNATSAEDRAELATLARGSGLTWASEPLACTAYWDRDDGCRGSALDHLLTTAAVSATRARGPCEDIGCEPGDSCPVFHREVSDHCPVTIELE